MLPEIASKVISILRFITVLSRFNFPLLQGDEFSSSFSLYNKIKDVGVVPASIIKQVNIVCKNQFLFVSRDQIEPLKLIRRI